MKPMQKNLYIICPDMRCQIHQPTSHKQCKCSGKATLIYGDIVDTRRIPFPLVFDHFIIDQYWLFPEDEFCVCSWLPKTNSNLANVIRLLNGTKLNWICHDIWHVELRGYEFWSWRVINTKGSQTDLQPQLRHLNPMLVEKSSDLSFILQFLCS